MYSIYIRSHSDHKSSLCLVSIPWSFVKITLLYAMTLSSLVSSMFPLLTVQRFSLENYNLMPTSIIICIAAHISRKTGKQSDFSSMNSIIMPTLKQDCHVSLPSNVYIKQCIKQYILNYYNKSPETID